MKLALTAPDLPPGARTLLGLIVAVAAPFAVAGALVPLRSHAPNATIALILAVVVAALATTTTRSAALVAALSASVGFDLFQTRPYGSLAITRSQDVQTTLLLLVIGLIVGQLSARNRQHRRSAADSSYDLARIHSVAEMVAQGEPVDQVILAVGNEVQDLLGLKSCRFDRTFADVPGPFIEREGALSWGAVRWGFGTLGLPTVEVSLIVESQSRPLGRYVLVARPGRRVTTEQLLTAVALADQVGAAITAQGLPDTSVS